MMDAYKLRYDQDAGLFFWRVAGRGISIGSVAGSATKDGYWVVKLGRKSYRAHRLAWYFVHGTWPTGEIDHINGDRQDNRICNLRVVDRAGNSQNQRRAHSDSGSGLLGVAFNKQHRRWQAKIQARKVMHHLGYFDTAEAAHAAYMTAKRSLHAGASH